MKLFVVILKFALVYTALKTITFFVIDRCSTYPGGRATFYGSHKIVVLLGMLALVKVCLHWSKKIKKKTIFLSFSRLL